MALVLSAGCANEAAVRSGAHVALALDTCVISLLLRTLVCQRARVLQTQGITERSVAEEGLRRS